MAPKKPTTTTRKRRTNPVPSTPRAAARARPKKPVLQVGRYFDTKSEHVKVPWTVSARKVVGGQIVAVRNFRFPTKHEANAFKPKLKDL